MATLLGATKSSSIDKELMSANKSILNAIKSFRKAIKLQSPMGLNLAIREANSKLEEVKDRTSYMIKILKQNNK